MGPRSPPGTVNDGDPNSFERLATACEWYLYGLKDNERHLVAARMWHKLTGPAKGVVRNFSPEELRAPTMLTGFWMFYEIVRFRSYRSLIPSLA